MWTGQRPARSLAWNGKDLAFKTALDNKWKPGDANSNDNKPGSRHAFQHEENRHMTHRQTLALLCGLCIARIGCCAQSFPGTGLEVDNPKTLSYVIDDLPQQATQLGVTIQQIRDKVEFRLRQAAIQPA